MPNFLSTIRGGGHILRPYYYGEHKWDDYLVDIQEAIAESKTNNFVMPSFDSGSLSENFSADIDSLSEALSEGFSSLNETLGDIVGGLGELDAKIGYGFFSVIDRQEQQIKLLNNVASGIENLGAGFQWGFTLMIDQQEKQIKLLNQIVDQLDTIREAVQLPSTTRAREFFSLGQRDVQSGFFPEALKKFLAAEHENEVNFPLQLQLGKLLLYGKNATDNVIDLPKAEEHLRLAARYADKWSRYRGEAFFHAAVAAYLIGQKEKQAGHMDAMSECLERALSHLRFAREFWPEFSEICYLAAKCHALLGQKREVLTDLKILAVVDPMGYLDKAIQDRDFYSVGSEVQVAFSVPLTTHSAWLRARKIMGRNFLGPTEATAYYHVVFSSAQLEALANIPFSEKTLIECKDSHLLVAGFPVSIMEMYAITRDKNVLSVQFTKGYPSIVSIVNKKVQLRWCLVKKTAIRNPRLEEVPLTCELVYAIVLNVLATSERLFEGFCVKCADEKTGGFYPPVLHWNSNGLDVYRGDSLDFATIRLHEP